MIFIVALDPASIEWAGQQGELGCDHLTGVLECLLQNCFIAETNTYYQIGPALIRAVKSLPETGTRKRLTAVIETLCGPGRNRRTPVIDDADSDNAEIGDILAGQVNHPELDAIITESSVAPSGSVEAFKLASFNQSDFARERSRRGCSVSFAPGSMEAAELFRRYFRKLLSMGDGLTIVDKVIGQELKNNYRDSLKHWCKFLRALNKPLVWTIHTENSDLHSIQRFLEDQLRGGAIKVNIVGHSLENLPHERYLRCAGICIDLGRGIDLFDRHGRIRDVRLGLGNDQQFCKEYPHLA